MKNNLINKFWIASPFILGGIMYFLLFHGEPNGLITSIVSGFCGAPIMYLFYHAPVSYKEKTGRSFETKSGIEIDEYKTVYTENKPMNIELKKIMQLYFIIGITPLIIMLFKIVF